METIYIAGSSAVTANDKGEWFLIQTKMHGRIMEMRHDVVVKIPLSNLDIGSLIKLHESFTFSLTRPAGLLASIEKEMKQKNSDVYEEIKKHVINDIISNIGKINGSSEEAVKSSNREVLLKQIMEGLETNDNKDQVASLGYCSVVKKNAAVKYRWSVITLRDSQKFAKVGELIDYVLKHFW